MGDETSQDEFHDMIAVLMQDVLSCWDKLHEAETLEEQAFWKRAFTRSVFAHIEGFAEYFRSQAFIAETNKLFSKISEGAGFTIHPGLLSLLARESFSITDDGEIKAQSLKTPFLPNLLFCLKNFAKIHGANFQIEKGDDWIRIKSAVRIRDGLMHPKNSKSLEISEKEVEDVAATLRWFYKQFHSIIRTRCSDTEFQEFPDNIFKLKLKKL